MWKQQNTSTLKQQKQTQTKQLFSLFFKKTKNKDQ